MSIYSDAVQNQLTTLTKYQNQLRQGTYTGQTVTFPTGFVSSGGDSQGVLVKIQGDDNVYFIGSSGRGFAVVPKNLMNNARWDAVNYTNPITTAETSDWGTGTVYTTPDSKDLYIVDNGITRKAQPSDIDASLAEGQTFRLGNGQDVYAVKNGKITYVSADDFKYTYGGNWDNVKDIDKDILNTSGEIASSKAKAAYDEENPPAETEQTDTLTSMLEKNRANLFKKAAVSQGSSSLNKNWNTTSSLDGGQQPTYNPYAKNLQAKKQAYAKQFNIKSSIE